MYQDLIHPTVVDFLLYGIYKNSITNLNDNHQMYKVSMYCCTRIFYNMINDSHEFHKITKSQSSNVKSLNASNNFCVSCQGPLDIFTLKLCNHPQMGTRGVINRSFICLVYICYTKISKVE